MGKIDVLSLMTSAKAHLEVVPELPKTLVFRHGVLKYVKVAGSIIDVEKIETENIEECIRDLVQNNPRLPCSVLKIDEITKVIMRYQDCVECINELIASNSNFELQEYIPSDENYARIIRVYVSMQNTCARVLENVISYDSHEHCDDRYLLSAAKKSEKLILSNSTAKLNRKALAIYGLIVKSSKIKPFTRVSVDFIKNGDKWYFISANAYMSRSSRNLENKKIMMTSPSPQHSTLTRNSTSKLPLTCKSSSSKKVLLSPKNNNAELRLNFLNLIDQKNLSRNYRKFKKTKYISDLKDMVADMKNAQKRLELIYDFPSYLANQAGQFLLEKVKLNNNNSNSMNDRIIKKNTIEEYTTEQYKRANKFWERFKPAKQN